MARRDGMGPGPSSTSPAPDVAEVSGLEPVALANLARSLLNTPTGTLRARRLSAQAIERAPDSGEVRAIYAEVQAAGVAQWYFSMVDDAERHRLYGRALGRALAQGGLCLDVGAGTSLFAMMALRAGADHVVACEKNEVVASAARDVVAANHLESRITVVTKASTDLILGDDLVDRADVVIWDNLANNLIGAGALPTLEDTARRLAKPGARFIPARGRILAALAEDEALDRRRMGVVEGFDLSAFNLLARPAYTLACQSDSLRLRSTPAVLFEFDFASGGPFSAGRTSVEVTGQGGSANGIVQWLEFDLDDHERYSTAPGLDVSAFGLEFHPLAEPLEVVEGEAFRIGASHDRQNLRIWRDGDG